MGDRFTDLQMLKLVEVYRDYECLWNVNSDLYKNRETRDNAYQEIAEKLNIPGISAKDIPRKIKNMRSSYYQELKRIEKSSRSGAGTDSLYKPKVSWFTTADGFLRTCRSKQETFLYYERHDEGADNSSDTTLDTNVEHSTIETTLQPVYAVMQTNLLDSQSIFNNSNDYTLPLTPSTSEQQSLSTEYSIHGTKPKQRKLDRRKRLHDDNEDIVNVLQRLENLISSPVNSTNQSLSQDEFYFFGLSVAAQLRNLPLRVAVETQNKIQNMLSAARLSSLVSDTQSSFNYNPSVLLSNSMENSDTNNAHCISTEVVSDIKHESDNDEPQVWEKS